MTDETEAQGIEFSDSDIADLKSLGITDGEAPKFHTILEVWNEVLKPAAAESLKKVTPQWASKMVQSYTQLHFYDMLELRDRYYSKLEALHVTLREHIEGDSDCLTYATAEEDVQHNGHHYRELLTEWQLQFLQWELEWDCMSEFAAPEMAAISEVHKIMFSDMGLLAFLEQIKFEFTEQDQAALAEALQARRVEVNGE